MTRKPGDRLTRADGAAIRIDIVTAHNVYYIAWPPGSDEGRALRMPPDEFEAAVAAEEMDAR